MADELLKYCGRYERTDNPKWLTKTYIVTLEPTKGLKVSWDIGNTGVSEYSLVTEQEFIVRFRGGQIYKFYPDWVPQRENKLLELQEWLTG